MATVTLTNRNLQYDFVSYIEHQTGKRVRQIYEMPHLMCRRVLFTDDTEAELREGVSYGDIEIIPITNFCASCGGLAHASIIDRYGRCSTSVKRFWDNVRKVYWHRYTKGK